MNIRYNLCKSGRRSSAFSLIELLIVIAIIGILFSISIPSLKSFIERNHFYVVKQRLQHALAYTKSLAIEHDQALVLCGSEDGELCDGNWQAPWIIRSVSTGKRLHIFAGDHYKVQIDWRGNFKDRHGLYFNAFGETAGQQGRFQIKLGQQQAELVVIRSGRVRGTP